MELTLSKLVASCDALETVRTSIRVQEVDEDNDVIEFASVDERDYLSFHADGNQTINLIESDDFAFTIKVTNSADQEEVLSVRAVIDRYLDISTIK